MSVPIALHDWPQLLPLVEQALDFSASEREHWLRGLALPEPLERALRGLLAERLALESDDFLSALPDCVAAPERAQTGSVFRPGARIGPWRLLRELGQGGMSVVWLAERADGQVERQVALKLPHAGPGQELLARRLLRERKILAALEHPHIARLYDVGLTDGGTPYLVMEHVQGNNLLVHANAQRLGIRQRVDLFQQVLGAVQYAHGKLVLHRDLKPGNIWVSAAAEVKLLDFGIAKLLAGAGEASDPTELTRAAGRQLTPSHASPEQLRGQVLGIGSDVYSLGVVLYELLCAQRPHSAWGGSEAQLEAAVLNDEARPPSRRGVDAAALAERNATSLAALAKTLRGDLDAIVAKCLAKTPELRYATVEALSADLARWQAGEPVTARTPSAWYRMCKFVRRHRASVGFGSTAAAALLAVSAVAVLQGHAAREQAARASMARDFLLDLFAQAAPDRLGGVELSATQLLERGRHKAQAQLGGQPRLQAELLAGIGDTQFQARDLNGAEAALHQAADLFRQTGDTAREAAARIARLEVAVLDRRLDALDALVRDLEPLRPTMAQDRLLQLAWLKARGQEAAFRKQPQAAQSWFTQCLDMADPRDPREAEMAFDVHLKLATLLAFQGRPDAADAQLRAAQAMQTQGTAAQSLDHTVSLAYARSDVDLYSDRYAAVLQWLPGGIAACEQGFGRTSPRCAELQERRLWALLRVGDDAQALAHASELDRSLAPTTARNAQFSSAYLLARIFAVNGQTGRHLPPLATLERLLQADAADPLPVAFQLPAVATLAETRLRAGDIEAAQQWLARGDAIVATLGDAELPAEQRRFRLARALVLQAQGAHHEALQAMSFYCDTAHPKALNSLLSLNCVRSLVATGQTARATDLVRHALAVLTHSLGADAPNTLRARRLLDELQLPGKPPQRRWDGSQIFIS